VKFCEILNLLVVARVVDVDDEVDGVEEVKVLVEVVGA
jgi:hypothetical protein